MPPNPAPNPLWIDLAALAERTPESADRKLLHGAALLLESCFEALETHRTEAERADATLEECRKAAEAICDLVSKTARQAEAAMPPEPAARERASLRGADEIAERWRRAARSILDLVTDAARQANAAMLVVPTSSESMPPLGRLTRAKRGRRVKSDKD